MSRVRASAVVPGPVEEVRALWFDPARWPTFLDGFARVSRLEGDWPRDGRVVWDSRRPTRERVIEQVTGPDVVAVEDVRVAGTQRVTFEPAGDGHVRIAVELEYRLKERSLAGPFVDVLYVRRRLIDGLRRTLRRFVIERQSEAVTMDA